MNTLLSVLLGIGLSAACGFRIFVPFLLVGIAARTGRLPLVAFAVIAWALFFGVRRLLRLLREFGRAAA